MCEGTELCNTCAVDCGVCPALISLILQHNDNMKRAAVFTDEGDVILKGTLTVNTPPAFDGNPSVYEFAVMGGSGNPVAILNMITGNMVIKGNLFTSENPLLSPSGFIVIDKTNNPISYIDDNGDFHIKQDLIPNIPNP